MAVLANDGRDARLKSECGWLGERLEALEGEALEIQLAHSLFPKIGGLATATRQNYPIWRPFFDGCQAHGCLRLSPFAQLLAVRAEVRATVHPRVSLDGTAATIARPICHAVGVERDLEIAALAVDVLVLLVERGSALGDRGIENAANL